MGKKTKNRLPINWFIIALIISLYILGYLLYPYLPERVPSHWNISGQVDGYSSKTFHVLFFPSMTLALYVLMSFAPILDPRPENYKKFQGVYEGFRWVMVGFFIVLYVVTTLFALGFPLSIGKIVRFGIGVLLVFIGNYFGKIKHNYTFGIKTPWTLANEEVWNKTHRSSGPLWVAAGLIWILSIFIAEKPAFIVSMGVLIIVSFYGFIYSYILFQKLKNQ
ncbi:MAG: SdpI family protein [Tepidanaerobacteraceae bacterium]|nr:SdpI family protein [Tepidanaerobacteraceae bacterium]